MQKNAIERFIAQERIAGHIRHVEHVPAKDALWSDIPPDMDPRLKDVLAARGFTKLYSHQREAWNEALAGHDIVVVTPTASGKTLCYNLPVMHCLLGDPNARALYVFPTKALSQDQQAELGELTSSLPVRTATYDGDTAQAVRKTARDEGRIIITNPDMLHSGVMPNHAKWIRFFSGLRYIVIDEMHSYRGVFGSHVANVIRRLIRIAAWYGSAPRFILCSATIGNPSELAEKLIGRSAAAITRSGAPQAAKTIVLYNPPLVDAAQGIRRSSADESMSVAALLLANKVRTILFARSRLKVEILSAYLNEKFKNIYTDNSGIRVEPYRSGLLPNERRAIEKGLREGAIHGVVSTNALELGIDIGGLDAAVIAGWPGSLASFWQQAGRAGRRQGASLAVYVASSSAIDQFLIDHPERFFSDQAESALIDPDNPYIYADHVKCAAFELPFADGEAFGADIGAALDFLAEEGTLRHTGGKWYWSDSSYPAEKISLRSATAENIVILDTTAGRSVVIGEMDRPSAKELLFDNAVYMHRGRQFVVKTLDTQNRQCLVEERESDYYTDSIVKTDIEVLSTDDEVTQDGLMLVTGDLLVRSSAEKFKKLKFHTNENIGYGEIFLRPEEMHTRALTMVFGADSSSGRFLASLHETDRDACLAAFCAVVHSLAGLTLLCERSDIGVHHRLHDARYNAPSVYVWDKYPGGTGLSEALAYKLPETCAAALERTQRCPCSDGCPSCIGAAEQFAETNRGFSRKQAARTVLELCLKALT